MKINNQIKEKMELVICTYIEDIILEFRNGQIARSEYDDLLLFCAEILRVPFLKMYDDYIERIVIDILNTIKSEIYLGENNNLIYIGMCKGVGNIAFSLRILKQKGMSVANFLEYFENWMTKYYYTHIDLYYNKPTVPLFYDSIYGLSGMMNYYLDYHLEQKEVIEGLLRYLISLTKNNNDNVINYFIMELPKYATEDTEKVPYLDFGMAHGIIGPLLVIAKARSLGVQVDGIENAIQILKTLYQEYTLVSEKGILKFPIQLSMEEYQNKKLTSCSFNNGWCYGNGCIVYGLMRVAKFYENENEFQFYKRALSKIMSEAIEKNDFFEPIVCHGYGSVLMIQMSIYKNTKEQQFLVNLEENIEATLKCHEEWMEKERYIKNYSLLEGAAGVMLSLLKTMGEEIESNKLLLLE